MADVKLGISGSEVTLAHTLTNSLPTKLGKTMTSAVMGDGTVRYGFGGSQRAWQLSWVLLTAAQLASLVTLRGYNQTLRYQNNDESATWYTVVVTDLTYDVIDPMASTVYYAASMTIEQTT